jgi:glycosyltransferase involved in cell wall biosynthesis
MATAVPCVATNVGDNEFIIKDTGRIVPVNDDQTLANAWQALVEMDKAEFKALGKAALQRALDNFTLKEQVQAHETLYETLHSHNRSNKQHKHDKRSELNHAEPSA